MCVALASSALRAWQAYAVNVFAQMQLRLKIALFFQHAHQEPHHKSCITTAFSQTTRCLLTAA